ncbi:fimbrial protein [Cedecea sp. NFIX57]|uniref:fimbrial protein n=1 Tax=Cedecea sp. NFIX57 TaxID=1566286 RepID=UPI000A0CAE5D|nr:fimbrial protein [Cedecea sp. NFIX57]SMG61777.1 Pilin (type 1 fimbria component protein) [Cedecea sp. NFIX57]
MNNHKQRHDIRFRKKTVVAAGGLILAVLAGTGVTLPAGAVDVRVTGALVSGPCSLKTTDITVSAGEASARFFYTHVPARTAGTGFDIVLQGCPPGVAGDARVTLTGTEDPALPGLLLPSAHRGMAFGIETADGHLLPVNQPVSAAKAFPLSAGETVMHLKGFIQAEPDAVRNRTLSPGPLQAVATFRVYYP